MKLGGELRRFSDAERIERHSSRDEVVRDNALLADRQHKQSPPGVLISPRILINVTNRKAKTAKYRVKL
ncbi:hypothetical protein C1280_32625 [Gemmata obscuriglobus]|uniref:Uncharacterized protein n=1 Tax=Gemmata obscuriglobus TaxID=114 RepID=A0A2Z3H5H5_9BACT|nr:hypothetical protein C1280_32625 [Gemmata obscuriglobus]